MVVSGRVGLRDAANLVHVRHRGDVRIEKELISAECAGHVTGPILQVGSTLLAFDTLCDPGHEQQPQGAEHADGGRLERAEGPHGRLTELIGNFFFTPFCLSRRTGWD